jgi:hypothetical protein
MNMKKINYYLYMLLPMLAFAFTACEEQVMDKTDLKTVTADIVWENAAYIGQFVNNTMRGGNDNNVDNLGIPAGERHLAGHCEESFGYGNGAYIVNNNYPIESPDGGLSWGNVDRWSYSNIRNINLFLDNVSNFTPELSEKDKWDYIGQMRTLRAWLYFEMVRVYGGVPIIRHAQRTDEELAVPRSKTSVCIEYIIADLDSAIAIPTDYFPIAKRDAANFGRINKAVAYALKGRILLTYASPQFTKSDQPPAGTKSVQDRWKEAYEACKTAKEKLAEAGYGLFRPNPDLSKSVDEIRAEVTKNYHDLFIGDENEMNEEMVWVRCYEPNVSNNPWDVEFRPESSSGKSYHFTTLEFANAFGKADGTPYTDMTIDYDKDADGTSGSVIYSGNDDNNDGVTNKAFWQNREPRFYATIGYNGAHWPLIRKDQNTTLPEDVDVESGMSQHEWIFKQSIVDNPFDQADNATNERGKGLLVRKFIDETCDYSKGDKCGTNWPLIRYAEVLLNYAEAAAMTDRPDEALDALKAIRRRAGILPGDDGSYGLGQPTGKDLIAAILHERAVELAFESFRFYDVRRWQQFTNDIVSGKPSTFYGKKLNGLRRHTVKAAMINIADSKTGATKGEKIAAVKAILEKGDLNTPEATAEYFKQFYHEVMLYDGAEFQYSVEKEDFLRIPYSHIKSNPVIEQTTGWTDDRGPGTFNPYE